MLSNRKVVCLPKDVTSYYLQTSVTERTRAVVIVVNSDFPVVELVATRDVVAVKLDIAGRQMVVASVYLPPGDPVDTYTSLLQERVTKHEGDIG